MEERRLPVVVRVVVADDLAAAPAGALARLVEARHLERHVMDAGPTRREKAMDEPVGAERLDDFELAAVRVAPGAEAKLGAAARPAVRRAAEDADEKRHGVGHAGQCERDVVERDRAHGLSVYCMRT
jgi:hypothetical protein